MNMLVMLLVPLCVYAQAMLEDLVIQKRSKHNIRIGVVIPYLSNDRRRLELLNIMIRQEHREDIVLVNDGGTEFTGFPNVVHTITHARHQPIGKSVMEGYDWLYDNGYDFICNLDSDVLVKPKWLSTSIALLQQYPDYIVSAFNELNHLNNCVVKTFVNHYLKNCGGGIHYCFTRALYRDFVRPSLREIELLGNLNYWDAGIIRRLQSSNRFVVSPRPSLVQHIGYKGFTASYKNRSFWQFAPDYELSAHETNLIRHIQPLRVLLKQPTV